MSRGHGEGGPACTGTVASDSGGEGSTGGQKPEPVTRGPSQENRQAGLRVQIPHAHPARLTECTLLLGGGSEGKGEWPGCFLPPFSLAGPLWVGWHFL